MEITGHIRELLYLHECVILPEFGGLLANYKQAEIEQQLYSFSPPSKEISFNRSLKTNDGLLINFISQKKAISYSSARQIVENFVKETNKTLSGGKEVSFKEIGVFKLDKHQNLLFDPYGTINYLRDSFGLTSFQFPAIEHYPDPDRIVRKHIDRKAAKEIESEIKRYPVLRKITIGIAAVSIFALILGFPKQTTFNNNTSTYHLSPGASEDIFRKPDELLNNPVSVNDAVQKLTNKRVALYYSEDKKEDQEKHEADKIIDTTNSISVKPIDDPIETVEKIPIEEKESLLNKIKTTDTGEHFFLIAGSFTSKEQAKDWMPSLIRKGFNPEILEPESGKYRISIGKFYQRSDIEEERQDAIARNVSVWILKKNN